MRETRQVQVHHTSYKPEFTILIFKAEHMILTWLNRMKKPPSQAFLGELHEWLEKKGAEAWPSYDDMENLRSQQDAKRALKRRKKAERRKQKKLHVRRSK